MSASDVADTAFQLSQQAFLNLVLARTACGPFSLLDLAVFPIADIGHLTPRAKSG